MTSASARTPIAVATILAFAAMPAVPSFAQEAPPDFSEITSELTPSVVAITTQRAVEEEDIMEMIPPELREAGRVDGASEAQLYRHVIFPQLSPVALTALIIIGHMSMKTFDLIMAVSGAQFLTEVPAVYMWQSLLTNDYAKAAAIAIVLLVVVAVLVIPYLVHNARTERQR
jgi:ABC-type sulfate transport system permease component